MAKAIKLVRYGAGQLNYPHLGAYRLRIEVGEAIEVSRYVFLYRRDPINIETGEPEDVFLTVASPADMSEYPAIEPNPNHPRPFFRQDFVEIDLRSTALALAAWEDVRAMVCRLLAAMDRLETLTAQEESWCGHVPEDTTSDTTTDETTSDTTTDEP